MNKDEVRQVILEAMVAIDEALSIDVSKTSVLSAADKLMIKDGTYRRQFQHFKRLLLRMLDSIDAPTSTDIIINPGMGRMIVDSWPMFNSSLGTRILRAEHEYRKYMKKN